MIADSDDGWRWFASLIRIIQHIYECCMVSRCKLSNPVASESRVTACLKSHFYNWGLLGPLPIIDVFSAMGRLVWQLTAESTAQHNASDSHPQLRPSESPQGNCYYRITSNCLQMTCFNATCFFRYVSVNYLDSLLWLLSDGTDDCVSIPIFS